MPTARYNSTAVGYQSKLIVIGGTALVNNEWTTQSTVELLDTTNGHWCTCANLPSPLTGVVVDDTLWEVEVKVVLLQRCLLLLYKHPSEVELHGNLCECASTGVDKYLFYQSVGTTQTSGIYELHPISGVCVCMISDIPARRSRASYCSGCGWQQGGLCRRCCKI